MIHNVHTRVLACPQERAGELIDQIPGRSSPIWPVDHWPAMLLDGPLGVGADGGHGPIRYRCTAYEAGRKVEFTFAPGMMRPGATHTFTVQDGPRPGTSVVRHEVLGRPTRLGALVWAAAIRPLHDAVIEDLFDRAQVAVGDPPPRRARWSPRVRITKSIAERIVPGPR